MILALLMMSTALARDWESLEGRFINRSEETFFCYGDSKDHPGLVCRRTLLAYEACRGDAVGKGDGAPVFKVPNRAEFYVDEGAVISPRDSYSWLLLDAARALRPGKYGWMNWTNFIHVMGDRQVIDCPKIENMCRAE